jgi:hypothetical protein
MTSRSDRPEPQPVKVRVQNHRDHHRQIGGTVLGLAIGPEAAQNLRLLQSALRAAGKPASKRAGLEYALQLATNAPKESR